MSAQPETETETAPETDQGTATLEDLQQALAKRDRENAGLRGELKKREDAMKQLTDAQLTDQERIVKERDELKAAVQQRDQQLSEIGVQSETLRVAARLGFSDPGDAFALLDRSAIQLDGNGKPTNLEELLKQLMAAKPYLAGHALVSGGTTNPGPRQPTGGRLDMNDVLRSKLASRG